MLRSSSKTRHLRSGLRRRPTKRDRRVFSLAWHNYFFNFLLLFDEFNATAARINCLSAALFNLSPS